MTQSNFNTRRHYHQLTSEQRGQIEALHDLGLTNMAIAERLHCHRSTIGRELKRGSVCQRNSDYFLYRHYFGETAQIKHEQHRFNATSIDEFIGQFKLNFPNQPCPSTPTVYRYIDQGWLDIKNLDLLQKLSRRLKRVVL